VPRCGYGKAVYDKTAGGERPMGTMIVCCGIDMEDEETFKQEFEWHMREVAEFVSGFSEYGEEA